MWSSADLSGVEETDSAGLALLLEWITWANHTVREIRFTDMPEKINAIAKTTEVDHLLKHGERWAGFIDAPGYRLFLFHKLVVKIVVFWRVTVINHVSAMLQIRFPDPDIRIESVLHK